MTSQADLADRYGAPAPWRRRLLVAFSVVVAAMATGFLLWVGWFHGNPGASSGPASFEIVDDHTATARVQVELEGDAEAECLVRALAADKTSVGELGFSPTSSGTYEVTIRTERRATTVEMVGCRVEGQNLWR